MTKAPSVLEIDGVRKTFGSNVAVNGVSLTVGGGEFLGLLGPSGCGKTTLLRMIAGFIVPDRGRIIVDGADITHLPPYGRNLGVVFQNYALFPHMTAAENVGYGLKVRRLARSDAAQRVRRALERVGLADAGERYPVQLSGGMQQRVALARALVIEPAILLLDEPLSALDKNLREEMQVELRMIQQQVGITTVFVTHDQEEAMTLSDRIAVMRAGNIMQIGSPREVYQTPSSRFVASFLGTTNILEATAGDTDGDGGLSVAFEEAQQKVRAPGAEVRPGQGVRIAVRPEDLHIGGTQGGIAGTIVDVFYQGHRLIVIFRSRGGVELRSFAAPNGWYLDKGDTAYASWAPSAASILRD